MMFSRSTLLSLNGGIRPSAVLNLLPFGFVQFTRLAAGQCWCTESWLSAWGTERIAWCAVKAMAPRCTLCRFA